MLTAVMVRELDNKTDICVIMSPLRGVCDFTGTAVAGVFYKYDAGRRRRRRLDVGVSRYKSGRRYAYAPRSLFEGSSTNSQIGADKLMAKLIGSWKRHSKRES